MSIAASAATGGPVGEPFVELHVDNMPSFARRSRIGLVAGGLAAYWPQFPNLLPQLEQSAAYVSHRMSQFDCDVVDVGFVSDAQEAATAAEKLRVAGCDVIVAFLSTYMTASMVAPIAIKSQAPVLLLNLQPPRRWTTLRSTLDSGWLTAERAHCPK